MTLSPVFRSHEAVEALRTEGVWDRLTGSAEGQRRAIARVTADLPRVLDARFIEASAASDERSVDMTFFQEFFFLILFRSVLEAIKFPPQALDTCSELNFCIKGTITAADNLFDDQDKSLLPLSAGQGQRFHSILQLLAFERLTDLVLDRGVAAGIFTPQTVLTLQQQRISRMAAIGELEGSEERGVTTVMAPGEMIERVHRVRGGALFELAFIAPALLSSGIDTQVIARAQRGIARLGTAFQIADDVTDFEADVARDTHNLLVSQITHAGTPEERSRLVSFRNNPDLNTDVVVEHFAQSARIVVEKAEEEARLSLSDLNAIGFWFPTHLSGLLVRAIVGLEGVERMRAL